MVQLCDLVVSTVLIYLFGCTLEIKIFGCTLENQNISVLLEIKGVVIYNIHEFYVKFILVGL